MRRICGSGGDVYGRARDAAIWKGEKIGPVEESGSGWCGGKSAHAHALESESAGGVTYVLSPAL